MVIDIGGALPVIGSIVACVILIAIGVVGFKAAGNKGGKGKDEDKKD